MKLKKAVDKDRATDLRLRREYHLTLEEYNRVFKHQGNKCGICREPVKPGKNRLAVDHGHILGELRGLLCSTCNRAIAKFQDSVVKLQAAVDYLTNFPVTVALGEPRFTAPGRVGTKLRAKRLAKMKVAAKSK